MHCDDWAQKARAASRGVNVRCMPDSGMFFGTHPRRRNSPKGHQRVDLQGFLSRACKEFFPAGLLGFSRAGSRIGCSPSSLPADYHSDLAWADGINSEGGPGYDVNMRWVYEHQEVSVDASCVAHYRNSGVIRTIFQRSLDIRAACSRSSQRVVWAGPGQVHLRAVRRSVRRHTGKRASDVLPHCVYTCT